MLALEPLRAEREYELNINWVLNNTVPWDEADCWSGYDCEYVQENSLDPEDLTDAPNHLLWGHVLYHKMEDGQYPFIVESLERWGFRFPLTIQLSPEGGTHTWGDGHHRLAAAIELGLPTVSVKAWPRFTARANLVRADSGEDSPEYWLDIGEDWSEADA